MRRPHRSIAALLAALFAAAAAAGTQPPLDERLRQEQAKLAKLQAELAELARGGRGPRASVQGAAAATAPAAGPTAPKGTGARGAATPKHDPPSPARVPAAPGAASALVRRPSLSAADVLYRLGRYGQARTVYEAALARKGLGKDDQIWAALQAGVCCRRLGDHDAAIHHFQAVIAAYPDHPWCTGHVAWALRAAQWEKRWARLELKAARGGGRNTGE